MLVFGVFDRAEDCVEGFYGGMGGLGIALERMSMLRVAMMYNNNMDKIRPYQKIAAKFQISQESAKYFLGGVQKSFKKEKPTHQLILEYIETQEFEFLPTSYEIAASLSESGFWPYELNAEPPILMDEEDIYF